MVTKKFSTNHWKTVPQGLKPSPMVILYGTAEPVPFVKGLFSGAPSRRIRSNGVETYL